MKHMTKRKHVTQLTSLQALTVQVVQKEHSWGRQINTPNILPSDQNLSARPFRYTYGGARLPYQSIESNLSLSFPTDIFNFDLNYHHNHQKAEIINILTQKLLHFIQERTELSSMELLVKNEPFRYRLSDIQILSFPQTIYLFKELLVGFEVLIDIFGFFEPKEEMVIINSASRWKLWVNSDFRSNEIQESNLSIRQFIYDLLKIVEKHSSVTNQSKLFFSCIEKYIKSGQCTFLKMLQKVNQFTKTNRIFQVNRVILSKGYHKEKSPIKISHFQSRLKTQHFEQGNSVLSPDIISTPISSRPVTRATPSPLKSNGKIICNYINFSQLGKTSNNWPFYSAEIPKTAHVGNNISDKMRHRPSFNLIEEKSLTPVKRNRKVAESEKKINFRSTQFLWRNQLDPSHQIRIPELPLKKDLIKRSPAHRSPMPKRTSSYNTKLGNVKNPIQYHMSGKKMFSPPKDLFQYQNSVTFPSRKNSQESENQILPLKFNKNIIANNDICCPSPNNSSSTKQLRNSSEMQPDLSSYAKLKQKDLKERPRNNYSVINNPDKKDYKPQNEQQEHTRKNLTVSHQFQIHKGNKNGDSKINQWTSNIAGGLFSDTMSIKHLKQSIKYKAEGDQLFQKQHLKNVKLDLLQKFGRKVSHVVMEEEGQVNKRRSYGDMQLIEQQMDQIKSHLQTDRNEDINKSTGKLRSPKKMICTDTKSIYDDKSQRSVVLPREANLIDSFNIRTQLLSLKRQRQ